MSGRKMIMVGLAKYTYKVICFGALVGGTYHLLESHEVWYSLLFGNIMIILTSALMWAWLSSE